MTVAWTKYASEVRGKQRRITYEAVFTPTVNWPSGHAAVLTDVLDLRGWTRAGVCYSNSLGVTATATPTPQFYSEGAAAWKSCQDLTAMSVSTGTNRVYMVKPVAQDLLSDPPWTGMGLVVSVDPVSAPSGTEFRVIVELEDESGGE